MNKLISTHWISLDGFIAGPMGEMDWIRGDDQLSSYEIGLVNRLAEPAALMDCAIALAKEVIEGAPLSVAAARNTVMLATEMGRAAAIDAGYAAHEIAYNSEDAQEGPRAFAEKRKPEWKGR